MLSFCISKEDLDGEHVYVVTISGPGLVDEVKMSSDNSDADSTADFIETAVSSALAELDDDESTMAQFTTNGFADGDNESISTCCHLLEEGEECDLFEMKNELIDIIEEESRHDPKYPWNRPQEVN